MRNPTFWWSAALMLTFTLALPSNSSSAQVQAASQDQDATPLKSGDRIRITIASFPDLSGEQVVLTDSTIQLPMAGKISVRGLTPAQAVTSITEALSPYVRRPQVGLSLMSLSPLRISVTGAVLHPGPRSVSPSDLQTSTINGRSQEGSPVVLSDVLALAGGIKPEADLRNITIRRVVPTQMVAGVKSAETARTEIAVNLWQAIQDGDLAQNPSIYDGDEIVIPTAPINQIDQQVLLSSTIAPTKIVVQVAGEVQKPGQLEISPTAGVNEAVAAAGGPTDKAKVKEIEIYRTAADGRIQRQTFEFGKTSISLRNGDVILVRKSGTSKALDFLGRIISPFTSLFYLFR